MLFTQQDLGISTNAFGILNESIYIDHNTISPNTASVIVNEDINAGIVRFSDVESISEEYGCDYIDAMIAIAESNDIDVEQLAVAVDEARIIEEPDIIYELANVVINPISENSLAYVFCESMVDAYIDSGDEDYLACIVNEKALTDYLSDVNQVAGNVIGNTVETGKRLFTKSGRQQLQTANTNMNYDQAQDSRTAHKIAKEGLKPTGNAYQAEEDVKDIISNMNNRQKSINRNKKMIAFNDKFHAGLDFAGKHKGKIAAGAGLVAGAGLAYKNRDKIKGVFGKIKGKFSGEKDKAVTNAQAVLKQAEGKSKSWISKKIASLRSIYQNYLQKAREAGPNAGTFKQIAAKILNVIDALLKKLENATA